MKKLSRVEELAKALAKAKKEAMRYVDSEDGGTCNFDSATVRLAGWREADVKKACDIAGVNCYKFTGRYFRPWHIGYTSGQANRRSRMAEAFSESLRASGYDSGMWYAAD
jgi:hypothetical protein